MLETPPFEIAPPRLAQQAAAMAKKAGKVFGSRDPLPPSAPKPPAQRDPAVPLLSCVCWTGKTSTGSTTAPLRKTVRRADGTTYQLVLDVGDILLLDGYEENEPFHNGEGISRLVLAGKGVRVVKG